MNDQITQIEASVLPFWKSVYEDALAHVPVEGHSDVRAGALALILRILLSSPGFRCTLLYRLSYASRHRLPVFGTIISKLLFWIGRHWYGCSIAGTARIAGGVVLPHPQGIVIGAAVCIGQRAWIYQNVTIGGAPNRSGMPVIGINARIYPGAVIAGPVHVGDDVWIGANTLVQDDVPGDTIVRAADAIHVAQKRREEA